MAAARQHLLAVYQRLQQAVAAAQDHADAIPLTTPDQFVQPFLSVTSEISSAVAASKQDLAGDSVLSGAVRTDLACQSGMGAHRQVTAVESLVLATPRPTSLDR